jgi:hypothetical protein
MYGFIKVFPPYNARDIFYTFYPLHSIAGIGISKISTNLDQFIKFSLKLNIKGLALILKKIIPFLLLTSSFFHYYQFTFMGIRTQPEYLDEGSFRVAEKLKDLGLSVIVTLENPSSFFFYILDVPGILFASNLNTASESSHKLLSLFDSNTGVNEYNRILIDYNVTSILFDSRYVSSKTREDIVNKINYPYTITQIDRFSLVIIDLGFEK